MFLKKFWISRRSFAIITSYLSPLVFIFVSVIIQHKMDAPLEKKALPENVKVAIVKIRLQIMNIFII